jgi:hypothetical protein
LHRPDHGGFISQCLHDGHRWPCPTLTVGTEDT